MIGTRRIPSLRYGLVACLWTALVSAAPGYRVVEPFPHASLEVPAAWREHRRAGDVIYAPPGVDFRSRSLGTGVRVFVESGASASAARRLETLMASYAKANPGLRADRPYVVEPGLNRAWVGYANVPADDPTTREAGWVMVARLPGGRWLCVIAVVPEAEAASNAGTLDHMRSSLRTPALS